MTAPVSSSAIFSNSSCSMPVTFAPILIALGLAAGMAATILLLNSLLGPRLRTKRKLEIYESGVPLVDASHKRMTGAAAGVILAAGSFRLNDIIATQQHTWLGFIPQWNVLLQPLGFLIFFISAFAETNRLPFDLPEAEPELVAGYHTEYSAMHFGSFFLAEYINVIVASAMTTTLYFGGWSLPGFHPQGLLGAVASIAIFAVKTSFFVLVFIWVRWTLPRFRYDQLMKRLVAYSSVSHLGLVVIGVGAFTTISLQGSILQMVNHGLSTGALFLLVGVLYERRHTREISAYGGVAGVVPVTTALFLIATLSSIGLPGLNGFVGEFLILLGTWTSPHRWWAVAAATGVILSAIYMLTLVQRVFWNPLTHEENKTIPEIRRSEFIAAAVLVLLMIWIGVRPNDVLDRLRVSVDALQEAVTAKQLAAKSVYGGAPWPRPRSAPGPPRRR